MCIIDDTVIAILTTRTKIVVQRLCDEMSGSCMWSAVGVRNGNFIMSDEGLYDVKVRK